MAEDEPATTPFEPLSPLEKKMCAALRAASADKRRSILVVPTHDSEKSLNACFLRWYLLEAIPALKLPIVYFELHHAVIADVLDLSGTKSEILPRFANCRFEGTIDLSDAEIAGFEMIAGEAVEILADRVTTKGSFRISAPERSSGNATSPPAGHPPVITGKIRLCGANISGNLDLRGCQLRSKDGSKQAAIQLFADGLVVKGNALLREGFRAEGEVCLNGCTIHRNLDCSGAVLWNPAGYSLSAAGAHIFGSLYLCRTHAWSIYPDPVLFESQGSLRLEGAKIDGDLDCRDGRFTAAAFVRANWAPDPAPGTASDKDLYAIEAGGVEVGGDVQLSGAFHARGIVDLIGAKVEGDFNCEDGFFDFPGEDPLYADGITVSGTTFLDRSSADNGRATTNGILRFPQASFKQGFFVDGAVFDVSGGYRNWMRGATTADELNGGHRNWVRGATTADELKCREPGICGIYAPLAEVSGEFGWRKIEKRGSGDPHNPLWLHLAGAKADALDDNKEAWQRLDSFDLTGCVYKSILHLAPDVAWRVDELDRQYALLNPKREAAARYGPVARLGFFITPWCVAARALTRALFRGPARRIYEGAKLGNAVKAFSPQPYIQLAKAVRASGYDKAANYVLIRLERNRTRYSDLNVLRQLGRWTLDLLLLYGFSPFRPILYLLVVAAISTGFFEKAHDEGSIVAVSDNAEACKPTAPSTAKCVAFNALVYATDTLVPLVDLNQKKNWGVAAPLTSTGPASESWWQGLVRAWAERPRWGPGLLIIFNSFFGWLMTTLFAAGVTGLVRGGAESD
ncbi:MAG: hypothetical protein ACLQME_12970 [Alphaproteobacteria bacterium]